MMNRGGPPCEMYFDNSGTTGGLLFFVSCVFTSVWTQLLCTLVTLTSGQCHLLDLLCMLSQPEPGSLSQITKYNQIKKEEKYVLKKCAVNNGGNQQQAF